MICELGPQGPSGIVQIRAVESPELSVAEQQNIMLMQNLHTKDVKWIS